MLDPGRSSSLVLSLRVRPEFVALATNITISWKGTNIVVYFEHPQITTVKRFITMGPVLVHFALHFGPLMFNAA
jgi:hypothetical protein